MDAIAQVGEHFWRGARAVALGLRGGAGQQVVDSGDQCRDFRLVGLQVDSSLQPAANRNPLQLLGKFADAGQLAPLQPVQHEEQRGDEREEEAQQPDDRHLSS